MMRCLAISGLALVMACGPGKSDDGTASDPTSGTTTAPTSATTTGDPVVTGTPSTSDTPETTQPDATTMTTTTTSGPTTSGATTTSTTGLEPCEDTLAGPISLEYVWPGSAPDCVDAQVDWKTKHIDCNIDCSTMTQLHGAGSAAGLQPVTQIAFGVDYGACGSGLTLGRFYLGHPNKPQAIVPANIECALDPWLGAHPVDGFLPDETPFEATMMIDSYTGDWLSEDPADPPRLFGSFSGALVGPFEAIHCAALDSYYDNCG